MNDDILVVDDKQGVRHLLGTLIRGEGYDVHLACNGLEAVQAVDRFHPRLVFMDVQMPVMNGLDALSRIKAIAPETKVVIMTAYISEEILSGAIKMGASCCLAKPFGIEKIKAFLQEHFDKR